MFLMMARNLGSIYVFRDFLHGLKLVAVVGCPREETQESGDEDVNDDKGHAYPEVSSIIA